MNAPDAPTSVVSFSVREHPPDRPLDANAAPRIVSTDLRIGGHGVNTAGEVTSFAFSIGEEVVARLESADIFDAARGAQLPQDDRPAWTIGSVIERMSAAGAPLYVLRFRVHRQTYMCIVGEDSIEGVA